MKKLKLHIKKLPGLDKYVIFSIVFTIAYTIFEFICTLVTSISHDVLTECVYRFFAGEVIVCGLIKIFKIVPLNNVKNKLNEAVGFLLEQEQEDIDR